MTESRPRTPRLLDPGYITWLRKQRCCLCWRPAEAAHIRIGLTGMQRRPDDRKAVPLCADHHREGPDAQHKMGEAAFWRLHGFDPFDLAERYVDRYLDANPRAPAPRVRKQRSVKPRKPRAQRQKIKSRNTLRRRK